MLPLAASGLEATLSVGQQGYSSGSSTVPAPILWDIGYKADTSTFVNIRLGYDVLSNATGRLTVSLAHQPEGSATLHVDSTYGSVVSSLSSTYKHGYTALGVLWTFKKAVEFGVGLDYRMETMSFDAASNVVGGSGFSMTGGSSSTSRPWARLNIAKAFPVSGNTFVAGAEAAFALASAPSLTESSSPDDAAKALAPKYQVGVYVGFRF